jgi:RNA-splicing ligase RtcB
MPGAHGTGIALGEFREYLLQAPQQPSSPLRGVAKEAPGAYKDVSAVINATEAAGLARKVARLRPKIVVKG